MDKNKELNDSICDFDPRELKGYPIGMFHCPKCGEMVVAGIKHPNYSILNDLEKEDNIDE